MCRGLTGLWLVGLSVNTEELEAIGETITETLDQWKGMRPDQLWQRLVERAVSYGPSLLAALLVFVVGYLLVRILMGLVKKLLMGSKVDKTLHYFVRTVIKTGLYAILVITCLGILGVPLTPMITAFGAIGLALSLAVQDSLSNLAGGLMILFNRPFAVGNFVTINDMSGTVKQIRLVYTVITSTDNKLIYLPNGDVAKATVTNFSAEATRRLDLTFSVRGDSDLPTARAIVERCVQRCDLVLQEPGPVVRVNGQTYTLVHIVCQVWVNAPDYFTVNAYLIEHVRKGLEEAGFLSLHGDTGPKPGGEKPGTESPG